MPSPWEVCLVYGVQVNTLTRFCELVPRLSSQILLPNTARLAHNWCYRSRYMTMDTKQQVLKENLRRYLTAGRAEKGRLLDEWTQLLCMHRKSMIRRLKQLQRRDSRLTHQRRGRREQYGPAVTGALREVWEISSELCG